MTLQALIDQARKLTLDEQLQLRDEIDRIVEGASETDTSLTPAQREDLRRRAEEWRSGRAETVPGDEAFEHLRKRI